MIKFKHALCCLMWISLIACLLSVDTLAEDDLVSNVIYLYLPACESCGKAEATIDALAAQPPLTADGAQMNVRVERINLAADPKTAIALFERYQLPEEDRIAPVVFAGDGYLSGYKAIASGLEALVIAAARSEGVDPAGHVPSDVGLDVLSWARSAVAGFVAGLNPCAISMLLLFLVVFAGWKRYAAAFLTTKFVVYLLLGTLLRQLFLRLATPTLATTAKWLLTIFAVSMALLNLVDAYELFQGRYGGVRNQLPIRLRGWLRRRIESAGASRGLLAASVVTGFTTAIGEFMCAGQLYLATLLFEVQAGMRFDLLLVYSTSFILPSVVVSVAIIRGKSHWRIANWMSEHMTLVKLLTALVMLGLVFIAWLH